MTNNPYTEEQEDKELLAMFGSMVSQYLQGYEYTKGPPLTDLKLNFNSPVDVPRQGFNEGGNVNDPSYSGSLPGLSDTNLSDVANTDTPASSNNVAATFATAALGIFAGSPLAGIAASLAANAIANMTTGKTVPQNVMDTLGIPGLSDVFGNLGITPDENTSYPQGIEEDSENATTGSVSKGTNNLKLHQPLVFRQQ